MDTVEARRLFRKVDEFISAAERRRKRHELASVIINTLVIAIWLGFIGYIINHL